MYDLNYVIDRCGVITGPWQMGKADQGVFALWMGKHYFKRPLKYIGYGGTGKQVRDFISIADLGDLIEIQLDRFDSLPHRLYNVGGGVASSLSLAETTLCAKKSRATASKSSESPKTGRSTSRSTLLTTLACIAIPAGRLPKRPRNDVRHLRVDPRTRRSRRSALALAEAS